MKPWVTGLSGLVLALSAFVADAAPIKVLWWDTTPEYGAQAPNVRREAMSTFLTNFGGGGVFTSTYRDAEFQPGTLAVEMASGNYDVVVFDSTPSGAQNSFNASDFGALRTAYDGGMNNLMLDGTLYIRNIDYNSETNFPGTNNALGGLLANQVMQLAMRGGGFMIGTDHNCCQFEANSLLQALLPSAAFSGITDPTNVGTFFGQDLLDGGAQAIAAVDVFNHWDAVPSQAIAPTGDYLDFNGSALTLFSQVDVADQGTFGLTAGERYSYISTSWKPGDGETDIDDPNPGGGGNPSLVPIPATLWLTGLAFLALAWTRRQGSSAQS
jgi:hypothetical protein